MPDSLPSAPDLMIITASEAYLPATIRKCEALIGRDVFEAILDNPDDPDATGTRNLTLS